MGSIARDFKKINYIPYVFFDVEKKAERRDKELRKRPEPAMDIKSRGFRFHFLFYKYGSKLIHTGWAFLILKK